MGPLDNRVSLGKLVQMDSQEMMVSKVTLERLVLPETRDKQVQ